MADRPRGRARGRARAAPGAPPPQAAPGAPPPQAGLAQQAPQKQEAYRPQGLREQAPPPVAAPQQYPPRGSGRATHRTGQREGQDQPLSHQMQQLSIGGNGNGNGASAGRGSVRGRRQLADNLVTKPPHVNTKKGVAGTPIQLTANYFALTNRTNWCLYQYRVDFAPEEDRTAVKKTLLRDHKDKLGGYLFDGSVLFSSQRYNPEPLELFSTNQHTNVQVRITMKLVGDITPGDYHYLQFFNILMRRCLGHLRLQLVGRNYFDARAKVDIREYRMELWPGYVTSIRQHENSILMCAEITHKVMRNDTCLDLLNECAQQSHGDYRNNFQSRIIGSVVLTAYNNRTYRIDDVDFGVTPASTFSMKGGETVSYRDYYRNKYQIQIRQPDQPMLVSRAKPREIRAGMAEFVYLVPELCQMTGLTDAMRENFQLMKALAEHTRVGPGLRIDKLLGFCTRLNSEQAVRDDLKLWNMGLSSKLVEFDGRLLPVEKIIQGRGINHQAGPDADFTKNLRSNPMLTCIGLERWVVLVPPRPRQDARSFVSTLIKAAAGMQFGIAQPQFQDIPDDRPGTYTEALENVIANLNPHLIMCVVSNNRSDRYSAIKKKCCVDRAVPTQVILAKNLASRGVMSIATKVAIQMNCKVGGSPWTVDIPLKGLMVAGFDVCHDTQSKGKSYGALVASLDKAVSRYYSTATPHTSGEELSNFLVADFAKALHAFKEHNNAFPSKIIFYRDGVGEGQIPYVYKHEVDLLNKKLAEVYRGPANMAFIIVNKRLNTRMFHRNDNPAPGTVVDDTITLPERYDFYLVSQSVRQGTVSPTSYNIIYDNAGLDADKLQRLTYKMTHLYYNWSGTVRVPAPVQYAHKLAFLAGQSLHRPPSSNWDTRLYYL